MTRNMIHVSVMQRVRREGAKLEQRFLPVAMRTSFLVFLVASGVCMAEDGKLKDLENQLKKVKEDIAQAEKKAGEENERIWVYKDRVVYSNDAVRVIYLEMKNLEKALVEKREQLENEMMKLDAYREILKSRKDAYERVKKLKDEELYVSQLIKNNQWRTNADAKAEDKAEAKKKQGE